MAEKRQYIEKITEQTLKLLNKTDNWFNYLKSASHHYKYNFYERYFIRAKRLNAQPVQATTGGISK